MGLIELVRGLQTSDETFEAAQRLATHLGKTTCVSQVRGCVGARVQVGVGRWGVAGSVCQRQRLVGRRGRAPAMFGLEQRCGRVLVGSALPRALCTQDRPGFIVNRVLMPYVNEAFFALMEACWGGGGGAGTRAARLRGAAPTVCHAPLGRPTAQLYGARPHNTSAARCACAQGVGSAHDIDVGMKLGTNVRAGTGGAGCVWWARRGPLSAACLLASAARLRPLPADARAHAALLVHAQVPMGPLALADFIGLDT